MRLYNVTVRRVWTMVEEADIAIEAKSRAEARRLAKEAVFSDNERPTWHEQGASWGRLTAPTVTEFPEDDDDGQPTERQEWHDYDPHC